MNKLEINSLLDRADYFADLDPLKIIKTLNGYVILNVFFENSTRTRVSFELAGRRLGAEVINISVDKSSHYIQYIENNLQNKYPQIIPICTSFEDLNLKPDSIDHMFCRWSLAWVQNPNKIISKIKNYLKKT